jgi:integrase/recombinase XerD
MYNTGARVQETADVQVPWLTLERPFKVELLGKGRKWRTCPLWDGTARVLKNLVIERGLKLGDDAHLFTSRLRCPMSRSAIADVVHKYANLAARRVPSLQRKPVTPHTLRHTTAMHLLQSGVEVNVIRSWLGHVSIATTNHYVEIDLQMKAKALEACRISVPRRRAGRWNSDPDILAWLEGL